MAAKVLTETIQSDSVLFVVLWLALEHEIRLVGGNYRDLTQVYGLHEGLLDKLLI